MFGQNGSKLSILLIVTMLIFSAFICYVLATTIQAEWRLNNDPAAIVGKIEWDEGYIFSGIVIDYRIRNYIVIAQSLLALLMSLATVSILWSAFKGNLLLTRNIVICRAISLALAISIPLEWAYKIFESKILVYENAVITGKLAGGSHYQFNFQFESFLVLSLALAFSILLEKGIKMQTDLEGTV